MVSEIYSYDEEKLRRAFETEFIGAPNWSRNPPKSELVEKDKNLKNLKLHEIHRHFEFRFVFNLML